MVSNSQYFNQFSAILKTPILERLCYLLNSSETKTDVNLEAIYIAQNLSLVSAQHQSKFQPLIDTFILIFEATLGLDPSNLILIKDAALKCMCCISIDTQSFMTRFDF
jgi:hypothetical protein